MHTTRPSGINDRSIHDHFRTMVPSFRLPRLRHSRRTHVVTDVVELLPQNSTPHQPGVCETDSTTPSIIFGHLGWLSAAPGDEAWPQDRSCSGMRRTQGAAIGSYDVVVVFCASLLCTFGSDISRLLRIMNISNMINSLLFSDSHT